MRRRPPGHCGICHSGYRTWAEHAVSEGHQAKAYRAHNPTVGGVGHKRLERRAAARRARRVEQAPEGRPIRVKAHRRHEPNDGPVKSVRVVKHRRGKPFEHVRREYTDTRGRRIGETYSVRGHLLKRWRIKA